MQAGIGLALALIAVRLLTKVAGVAALARASGTTWRKGALTGLALMPISVFVILLLEQTRYLGVDLLDQLAPLAAVTLVLELLGPIATQWALRRAGETPGNTAEADMALEAFKTSEPLTMGVELELQLVSLSDFDLVEASPDMLDLLARKTFPGNVMPEITREHDRGLDRRADRRTTALLRQLREIRDALVAAGDTPQRRRLRRRHAPVPAVVGSHASTPSRASSEVSALYGYLAKQFTIFGQHVHIGCASGDEALYLLHSLNRYVPHFIALSASSPFVQGHDTLVQLGAPELGVRLSAERARAVHARAGHDFESAYFAKMERTGVVKSMKDFYWDIRPKPEYGTIELRVCDTPLTVERAAALAGYLQALCRYLLERVGTPRRARATTWSTPTTASRLAASAWTARWCTRRPTSRCRCARTSSTPCARLNAMPR